MELTQEQIDKLATVQLGTGNHKEGAGFCVMEAVAWVTGGPWTDMPGCVSPDIAKLAQRVNDQWVGDGRTEQLIARVPFMLRADHSMEARRSRAYFAAEHARASAVRALKSRGRDTTAIEALPPIVDRPTAKNLEKALRDAAAYAAAYAYADAAYAAAYADAAYAAAAADAAAYAAAYAAAAAYADAYAAAYADAAKRHKIRHETRLAIFDAWIGYGAA